MQKWYSFVNLYNVKYIYFKYNNDIYSIYFNRLHLYIYMILMILLPFFVHRLILKFDSNLQISDNTAIWDIWLQQLTKDNHIIYF